MSGFFFCGIMLEPVVNESSSSTKRNSHDDQRITSSEKRERCVMMSEKAERSSTQKSLSETPSMLFSEMPSKPSISAVKRRSVG